MSDYADEYADDEIEEIEAYCVSCKQKTVMENPIPVWTRRGTPGTKGTCEICGTTTFRMGKTDAHRLSGKPDMEEVLGATSGDAPRKGKNAKYTTYINHSPADAAFAERLVDDLSKMGIPSFATPLESPDVNWASGIHPTLAESKQMVVVLSGDAKNHDELEQNWSIFKQQRKPIVVAMVNNVEVPDDLRRSPRYDFSEDYKSAFRQMIQTLMS